MLFVSVCCKGNLVLNVTEELSDVKPEDSERGCGDSLGCWCTWLPKKVIEQGKGRVGAAREGHGRNVWKGLVPPHCFWVL